MSLGPPKPHERTRRQRCEARAPCASGDGGSVSRTKRPACRGAAAVRWLKTLAARAMRVPAVARQELSVTEAKHGNERRRPGTAGQSWRDACMRSATQPRWRRSGAKLASGVTAVGARHQPRKPLLPFYSSASSCSRSWRLSFAAGWVALWTAVSRAIETCV